MATNNANAMIQSIKNAMFKSNNTDPWHISSTSPMQLHQERLILLHHARKCPHNEHDVNPCPTPQCAEAKRIWKHIAGGCKDKNCSYCYSSRYVLTHYRECKDQECGVCTPVREEIQLRKKQQGQILQTSTFETNMTPSTHPSTTTPRLINEEEVAPSQKPVPTNPMPTLAVAICRTANNVGRIIPVRTRSFSSMSDISHGSSIVSSNRSSAPSSCGSTYSTRSSLQRSRGSGSCRFSCRHNCGGIKCRENLGIAHFCKEIKEE